MKTICVSVFDTITALTPPTETVAEVDNPVPVTVIF